MLHNDIRDTINKVSTSLIPDPSPCYGYLKNYIILRNCLAHKSGRITEDEINLEIRLPYIDEDQIKKAIADTSNTPISPQTVIKKWNVNDTINLHISEVEGIAYGLLKTLYLIFKHMYKAADMHVERLEKNEAG